jgi:hypothetical protein
LDCEPTVVERASLSVRIEVSSGSDSPVFFAYRTCDGTATARQGNFIESFHTVFCQPSQTRYPNVFYVSIGSLTDDQRAAGGATFKIKLGTVIGAVPEAMEKTVTILPAEK